jgi:hypothetical protein
MHENIREQMERIALNEVDYDRLLTYTPNHCNKIKGLRPYQQQVHENGRFNLKRMH